MRLLTLKLAALFAFCGGPLALADSLKLHMHGEVAFAIAFLPSAALVFGVHSLWRALHERWNIAMVSLGGVGAIALTGTNLFALWQLAEGAPRADARLIELGIAVGTALAAYYGYAAFRFFRSPRIAPGGATASTAQRDTAKPGRYGIEDAMTFGWASWGYSRTVRRLRAARHPEVAFDGSALRFTGYPFEPASIFPSGTVEGDQVAEVNLHPLCQLRLKNGDILFVPWSGKEAVIAFINQNDVPVVNRTAVWSGLLDPFLDTWEEQKTIDAQFAWFASLGLDRKSVDRWRREVAVAMMAYNFGTRLWEWTGLDLYDVLVAQRARLSPTDFADFYRRAIRLAAVDQPSPVRKPSPDSIEGALFTVLLEWYPEEKGGAAEDFRKRRDKRGEDIERLRSQLAAELASAYSQPHRHYHTLAHIQKCFDELVTVWSYGVRVNEVRWALLFHDSIYDPQRHDNEARSADWACSVMAQLKCAEDAKARVRAMILATGHSGEPRTPDEALLLDIDLSILGAEEAAFDEYDRSIRAEYSWVPEQDYRRGRAKVLESFIGRKRVYHTAVYRKRYEARARANLERALTRLGAIGPATTN